MSTRSRIATVATTGFKSIYCHHDGEPTDNGRILLEHYQDTRKVSQLIALGDISSLGAEIGVKHPFDNPWDEPTRSVYQAKYGTMTLAYGRDRGEKDVGALDSPSFADLVVIADQSSAEWLYLWTGKTWRFGPVRPTMKLRGLKTLAPAHVVV